MNFAVRVLTIGVNITDLGCGKTWRVKTHASAADLEVFLGVETLVTGEELVRIVYA